MKDIVRAPHFEGMFYDSDPEGLKIQIGAKDYSHNNPDQQSLYPDHLSLEHDDPSTNRTHILGGCIIPHGAYEYCGSVIKSTIHGANSFFNRFSTDHTFNHEKKPTRIIILAPELNPSTEGIKIPLSNWFRSPIGVSKVDREFCEILQSSSMLVQIDETSHLQEYTIEILLPYLQSFFPDLPIVPLLVQSTTPPQRLNTLLSGLLIAEQESSGSSFVIAVTNCHKPAPLPKAIELQKTYLDLLADLPRNRIIDRIEAENSLEMYKPYGFFASALGIYFMSELYGKLDLTWGEGTISPSIDEQNNRIHYQGLTIFHQEN